MSEWNISSGSKGNKLDELKEKNDHNEKMAGIKAGKIGKCIGYQDGASQNVAFIICISLLLCAVLLSLCKAYYDIWSIVIPVLTLALGYLFGKQ